MGKKNALLLIISGFFFVYFISLIYIPNTKFHINTERILNQPDTSGNFKPYSRQQNHLNDFNHLTCYFNYCYLFGIGELVQDVEGDQLPEVGFKILQSNLQNLKQVKSKIASWESFKPFTKLNGQLYTVHQLNPCPDHPAGLVFILTYSVDSVREKVEFEITVLRLVHESWTSKPELLMTSRKIHGNFHVQDMWVSEKYIIFKRWGSGHIFEYFPISDLLQASGKVTPIRLKPGPTDYPSNLLKYHRGEIVSKNYTQFYDHWSLNDLETVNLIMCQVTQDPSSHNPGKYEIIYFQRDAQGTWTESIKRQIDLPIQRRVQPRPRLSPVSFSVGIPRRLEIHSMRAHSKPTFVRGGDYLLNIIDPGILITTIDLTQGLVYPFLKRLELVDHLISKWGHDYMDRHSLNDDWELDSDPADPYYGEDGGLPYDDDFSTGLNEHVKYAIMDPKGDQLFILTTSDRVKIFQKVWLDIRARREYYGDDIGSKEPLVEVKKHLKWEMEYQLKFKDIKVITGFQLIEDEKQVKLVVMDDSYSLHLLPLGVDLWGSHSPQWSFFREKPLMVICMSVIVLSFSYIEYLQP